MNNYDTIKLTDVKADFSANYRLSTEYGTEDELKAMGKSILDGGLPKMDALVITKESKRLVAGFSRYLALVIQPGHEEFEVPVRFESEKVNEAEKIRLNLASNIHRKPSMWSDAIALERLVKLGKEKKLADFMPGTSAAYRSQLKTLVACDDSVRDAGANGQISPTLVLQLIAENNSRPLLKTDEKPKDGVAYRLCFNDLQAQIALDLEQANGAKLTAIDFAKLLSKPSLPVHTSAPVTPPVDANAPVTPPVDAKEKAETDANTKADKIAKETTVKLQADLEVAQALLDEQAKAQEAGAKGIAELPTLTGTPENPSGLPPTPSALAGWHDVIVPATVPATAPATAPAVPKLAGESQSHGDALKGRLAVFCQSIQNTLDGKASDTAKLQFIRVLVGKFVGKEDLY